MDEFKEIEQNLRQSLQHVAAPEGFTDRVMARVANRKSITPARRVYAVMPTRTGWWTAVAACLALAIGGGGTLHVHHLHQQREAAMQAQLDLAMQMTNHALNEVAIGLDRSPMGRFTQILNATQK